jgi:hypothetical protein
VIANVFTMLRAKKSLSKIERKLSSVSCEGSTSTRHQPVRTDSLCGRRAVTNRPIVGMAHISAATMSAILVGAARIRFTSSPRRGTAGRSRP